MYFLMQILISIFAHIAELIIIVILYFVIALPFAYFKYLLNREKPFLMTLKDYAVSFERFINILRLLVGVLFVILLVYILSI